MSILIINLSHEALFATSVICRDSPTPNCKRNSGGAKKRWGPQPKCITEVDYSRDWFLGILLSDHLVKCKFNRKLAPCSLIINLSCEALFVISVICRDSPSPQQQAQLRWGEKSGGDHSPSVPQKSTTVDTSCIVPHNS